MKNNVIELEKAIYEVNREKAEIEKVFKEYQKKLENLYNYEKLDIINYDLFEEKEENEGKYLHGLKKELDKLQRELENLQNVEIKYN